MRIMMTTTRFVLLSDMAKQPTKWFSSHDVCEILGAQENPDRIYNVTNGLTKIGFLEHRIRRDNMSPTVVKKRLMWRITDTGLNALDHYVNYNKKNGELPFEMSIEKTEPQTMMNPMPLVEQTPPIEPAVAAIPLPAVPQPDQPSTETISKLEAEIARLKAMVEKYATVEINVPNVGPVRMTKDEAYGLWLYLTRYSKETEPN